MAITGKSPDIPSHVAVGWDLFNDNLHLVIRKNRRAAYALGLVLQPAYQLDLFGGGKGGTDCSAYRHQAVIR